MLDVVLYTSPVTVSSTGVGYSRGTSMYRLSPYIKDVRLTRAMQGEEWALEFSFREEHIQEHGLPFWQAPYLMYEVVVPNLFTGVVWRVDRMYKGEAGYIAVQDIYNLVRAGYTDKDNNDLTWPTQVTGNDTSSTNNATTMTDTGASFTTTGDGLVGQTIRNTTDGSWGIIASNTATSVTVHRMMGGTDNDWDTGDAYVIGEWLGDWPSITQFGRREKVLSPTYIDSTMAEANTRSTLAQQKSPTDITESISRQGGDSLSVTATGLYITANNRYIPAATSSPSLVDVSDYITTIIGDYCDFLEAGEIQTNGTKTPAGVENDTPAWEHLLALTLSSSSTSFFRLKCLGNKLHYVALDTTPVYYWHGDRYSYSGVGRVDKYYMCPAVIRNLTTYQRTLLPGSFIQDSRDRIPQFIEVSDRDDVPYITMTGWGENVEREIQANVDWIERSKEVGKDATSDDDSSQV